MVAVLIDVFKEGGLVETIELSASKRMYTVGRQAGVADIVLGHGSISRDHATLTVSSSGSVVVADLNSAHGTKLSGKRIQPNTPHLLPLGRSLVFGVSSRIFKLREGGGGFMSSATAPDKGITAADDPRVQAALRVLREGAEGLERPRPDGYFKLSCLAICEELERTGCTEVLLASLPSTLEEAAEAREESGELLLRARGGHAAHLRVDASLCLVRIGADGPDASGFELPPTLIFGASFREWNSLRSRGLGPGSEPARPIRLCACAPPRGAKLESLGGKAADLLVHVRTASLRKWGIEVYRDAALELELPQEGPQLGPAAALAPGAAPPAEPLVCGGDHEGGAIGPWHFERVLNARDGSEMMGGAEISPLREAHERSLVAVAEAATNKADAAEARRRQTEAAGLRAIGNTPQAVPAPAPRHNPYAAHLDGEADAEDEVEDMGVQMRKRQR